MDPEEWRDDARDREENRQAQEYFPFEEREFFRPVLALLLRSLGFTAHRAPRRTPRLPLLSPVVRLGCDTASLAHQ